MLRRCAQGLRLRDDGRRRKIDATVIWRTDRPPLFHLGNAGKHTREAALAHVLVVDDYHAIREMICDALEARADHRVTATANAEAALPLLDCDRPDIAVIDALLPGMSGTELARHAIEREIPVVMITGGPAADTALRAAEVPYLGKPFPLARLEATIAAQLAEPADHIARMRTRLSALRSADPGYPVSPGAYGAAGAPRRAAGGGSPTSLSVKQG
ncbi:MAG TPA: response regulator [Stellaceae bacterium]|nr:response regulator [Stellaceae bacterium]